MTFTSTREVRSTKYMNSFQTPFLRRAEECTSTGLIGLAAKLTETVHQRKSCRPDRLAPGTGCAVWSNKKLYPERGEPRIAGYYDQERKSTQSRFGGEEEAKQGRKQYAKGRKRDAQQKGEPVQAVQAVQAVRAVSP